MGIGSPYFGPAFLLFDVILQTYLEKQEQLWCAFPASLVPRGTPHLNIFFKAKSLLG